MPTGILVNCAAVLIGSVIGAAAGKSCQVRRNFTQMPYIPAGDRTH